MSLVDYAYSSSENEDSSHLSEEPQCKKVKKKEDPFKNCDKVSLPKAALKLGLPLKKVDDDYAEDPSKHGGRKRAFKHERGNWASYVYIPVNNEMWEEVQEICQAELAEIVEMQTPTDDLHISMSKTVVLQYHLIEPFSKSLEVQLRTTDHFSICLDHLKVYTNEEKTRTFMAFQVNDIYFDLLYGIMVKVDHVMKEFRLPVFYEDPSFHMSFLWCLGDKVDLINERLEKISLQLKEKLEFFNYSTQVKNICFNSGFKQYTFPLKKL